jgi:hypothetical protein
MNETRLMGAKPVLAEIDVLWDLYLQCRSVFPTIDPRLVGQRKFTTAPYYLRRGYMATIELKEPISVEFIKKNLRLGKWTNENAIIRLHGVMNHYGFLQKIDHDLPGATEVDLMRRMRNAFTKTCLNYKPNDPDNLKLRARVISHFGLAESDFSNGDIPTPINTVVEPIFGRCKAYIEAKCKAHNKAMQSDCL